jgi:hypothetical protein
MEFAPLAIDAAVNCASVSYVPYEFSQCVGLIGTACGKVETGREGEDWFLLVGITVTIDRKFKSGPTEFFGAYVR